MSQSNFQGDVSEKRQFETDGVRRVVGMEFT